ncbi:unnamed protein product [Calicophoron daubneyi]|uniref:Uncharacterized protein n=1 Tax=Calicophoron daubneyi TaxID=300641 RepID=A0AAV2TF05_CALDB
MRYLDQNCIDRYKKCELSGPSSVRNGRGSKQSSGFSVEPLYGFYSSPKAYTAFFILKLIGGNPQAVEQSVVNDDLYFHSLQSETEDISLPLARLTIVIRSPK